MWLKWIVATPNLKRSDSLDKKFDINFLENPWRWKWDLRIKSHWIFYIRYFNDNLVNFRVSGKIELWNIIWPMAIALNLNILSDFFLTKNDLTFLCSECGTNVCFKLLIFYLNERFRTESLFHGNVSQWNSNRIFWRFYRIWHSLSERCYQCSINKLTDFSKVLSVVE